MALPRSRGDREQDKFVEDASGDVAVRVVAEDALPISGGGSGGGNNGYTAKPSGLNADAVSAYASGTTIVVTGLPYTFTEYDISSIQQIPTSGAVTTFSSISDWEVSGTTITIATGTFAASDEFVVNLTGEVKGYTPASTSSRMFDISPDRQAYVPAHSWIDETNQAADTYRQRISIEQYTGVSAHLECSGGVTMNIWLSNKLDPSVSTDDDWVEDTNFTPLVDGKDMYSQDSPQKYKWMMIKHVTSDGTNATEADIIRFN